MSPVGFEPTISEGERPQTNALNRASTGTGNFEVVDNKYCNSNNWTVKFFTYKHDNILSCPQPNATPTVLLCVNHIQLCKKCFNHIFNVGFLMYNLCRLCIIDINSKETTECETL
jgi:hypothetical protein